MAMTSSMKSGRARARSGLGEAVVLASMGTVSAVIAAVLVLQLGTPVWAASVVAAMFLAAVLAAHVLVRRSEQLAELRREMENLDARLGRVAAAAPRVDLPTAPGLRSEQLRAETPNAEPLRAAAPMAPPTAPHLRIEPTGGPGLAGTSARPEPAADTRTQELQSPAQLATLPPVVARLPATAEDDEPSIDALVAETTPRAPIDDLLKRLAGDISAASAMRETGSAAEPEAAVGRGAVGDVDALDVSDLAVIGAWPATDQATGDDAGEDATYAHETMSGADVPAVGSARVAAQGKIAAVVDALANERIDVFLEPIIGFESLAAEHYDVTVRLRHADGTPLEAAEFADDVRGTGLLALIDTVKIARTKRLVTQRMVDGSERVLSAIDSETLASTQFHEDVADLAGSDRAITARLVLTFRQADVRAFAPVEWQALARLAAIGFCFGIDSITDLDMDFAELAGGGFTFARLDADVFLDGMLVAGAERVSPADVCRHLTESGLGLVVRRIDDPKRLARVMGFGVMMGQGTMFGGRRPAEDVLAARPWHDA
ncbi:MAG: EAL domain-containing protein [Hyphomicrobiaceae bacterium]